MFDSSTSPLMNTKETMLQEFAGYNVYKLDIDRKDDSTVYTVHMENPLGKNTGKIKLEWELAHYVKVEMGGIDDGGPTDAQQIAHLMRRQIDVDIDEFVK